MGEEVVEVVTNGIDMAQLITLLKQGVTGVFDISSQAFGFIASNPLCVFFMGCGFAGVALAVIRKAIRVAKRS